MSGRRTWCHRGRGTCCPCWARRRSPRVGGGRQRSEQNREVSLSHIVAQDGQSESGVLREVGVERQIGPSAGQVVILNHQAAQIAARARVKPEDSVKGGRRLRKVAGHHNEPLALSGHCESVEHSERVVIEQITRWKGPSVGERAGGPARSDNAFRQCLSSDASRKIGRAHV